MAIALPRSRRRLLPACRPGAPDRAARRRRGGRAPRHRSPPHPRQRTHLHAPTFTYVYCTKMMRGTHAGSRSSLPATLPQHAADGAWRRWPRSSAGAAAASRVRPLQRLSLAALAGQQDAQPAAQQQAQQPQQQQSQQSQQSQVPEAHIPVPLELWDMNLWHYQPWWLQPPLILGTGLAFVLVSLALDNEDAGKTLALAAPVVVLYWGIALFLLPRRFKSFAVSYIESHPEAEEAALEQLQEALEQQQHEAEEQQQLQQQQQQDVQS